MDHNHEWAIYLLFAFFDGSWEFNVVYSTLKGSGIYSTPKGSDVVYSTLRGPGIVEFTPGESRKTYTVSYGQVCAIVPPLLTNEYTHRAISPSRF